MKKARRVQQIIRRAVKKFHLEEKGVPFNAIEQVRVKLPGTCTLREGATIADGVNQYNLFGPRIELVRENPQAFDERERGGWFLQFPGRS